MAHFSLKRNDYIPIGHALATRKIVRGPGWKISPPVPQICPAAQTIFLLIFAGLTPASKVGQHGLKPILRDSKWRAWPALLVRTTPAIYDLECVILVSCSISRFFRSIPPGAENPPNEPPDVIMRWQGMIRGIRFLLSALPTARAACGLPICCANSLYDIVPAGFNRLQRRKTRLVKSPAHDRSTLQLKPTCRPWK